MTIGNDLTVTNDLTVSGVLNSDDITASTMTASGNVVVSGNLTVNGTTTTVNSTTVSIDDPIFELGESGSDDNLDRGIKFLYNNGGAKTGFFGFDDSTSKFTFIADATDSSSVFSGSAGNVAFGGVEATSITSTGGITATTGTFSGAISGTSLALSGSITSLDGAPTNGQF